MQIFHIKQENSYFDILAILTDDNLYLYSKIHQINNNKQRDSLKTSINEH